MRKILYFFVGLVLFSACTSDDEAKRWTVTVQSANNSMGYTSGMGVYDNNATATIKATPHAGFVFETWNDGNNANPREVIVNRDMSFTAYFHAVGDNPVPIDSQYVDFNVEWVFGLWVRENSHEYWRFNNDGTGVTWDTDEEVTEEESNLIFTWGVSGHTMTLVFQDQMGNQIVPRDYYLCSQTPDAMVLSDIYGMTRKYCRVSY